MLDEYQALVEGLIDLLDLGLHHQLHVEGDLAAYAGDKAEEAADLGDTVADGVPGDFRLAEAKLRISPACTSRPRVPSGQRAGGAAEFADQDARPQLPEDAGDGARTRRARSRIYSRR